jgi:hypothetical protein
VRSCGAVITEYFSRLQYLRDHDDLFSGTKVQFHLLCSGAASCIVYKRRNSIRYNASNLVELWTNSLLVARSDIFTSQHSRTHHQKSFRFATSFTLQCTLWVQSEFLFHLAINQIPRGCIISPPWRRAEW